MKDLQRHFEICKSELDAIGIEYGNIRNIEINTRAKSRWGQCREVEYWGCWENRVFSINISIELLNDKVSDEALHNTIIHEILHTCRGCMNHGREWKELAEFVNDCYACYNIKRCTSSAEKGIEIQHNHRYKMVCEHCGKVWYRDRKPKYSTYTHTVDKGRIVIKPIFT